MCCVVFAPALYVHGLVLRHCTQLRGRGPPWTVARRGSGALHVITGTGSGRRHSQVRMHTAGGEAEAVFGCACSITRLVHACRQRVGGGEVVSVALRRSGMQAIRECRAAVSSSCSTACIHISTAEASRICSPRLLRKREFWTHGWLECTLFLSTIACTITAHSLHAFGSTTCLDSKTSYSDGAQSRAPL